MLIIGILMGLAVVYGLVWAIIDGDSESTMEMMSRSLESIANMDAVVLPENWNMQISFPPEELCPWCDMDIHGRKGDTCPCCGAPRKKVKN